MPFLSVNGIDLQPANGTAFKHTLEAIGDGRKRSWNGASIKNYRARKWKVAGGTLGLPQDQAVALSLMLAGEVDSAGFDDSTTGTDKGLVATSTGTVTYPTSAPTPKYGAACLSLAAGTGNNVKWAVGAYTARSWIAWANESSVWNHYIQTRSASYKNGVFLSSSTQAWLFTSAVAGVTGIQGIASVQSYYDDWVTMPWLIPAAWVPSIYAFHSANAWPMAPYVTVSGDFHPETLTMDGDFGEAQAQQAFINGASTLSDNLRIVDIDMQEA